MDFILQLDCVRIGISRYRVKRALLSSRTEGKQTIYRFPLSFNLYFVENEVLKENCYEKMIEITRFHSYFQLTAET